MALPSVEKAFGTVLQLYIVIEDDKESQISNKKFNENTKNKVQMTKFLT